MWGHISGGELVRTEQPEYLAAAIGERLTAGPYDEGLQVVVAVN